MSELTQAKNISSLVTEYLDQPPSCLEFCPKEPNYFVIGTYLLQEIKESSENREAEDQDDTLDESASVSIRQTKTGSLQLWQVDVGIPKFQQKQVVSLPYAIFDLKFHPLQQHILGVAGSDGSVSIYSVATATNSGGNEMECPQITHTWTTTLSEHSTLYFSWFPQAWFPLPTDPFTDGFATSFADGTVRVFAFNSKAGDPFENTPNQTGDPEGGVCWEYLPERRQGIEPWLIVLSSYKNRAVNGRKESFLWIGDDMGSFWQQSYILPEAENGGQLSDNLEDDFRLCEQHASSSLNDGGRHHQAGVTAILPLPISDLVNQAPIVLTGSYDEFIRVYHATGRGAVLAEKRLGGGVWRLQVISDETVVVDRVSATSGVSIVQTRFLVLASCMHAGTRIVRVTWERKRGKADDNDEVGDWQIEILAQFTEHESMNYASSIWRGGTRAQQDVVCISTSFYDKRLCLWRAQI